MICFNRRIVWWLEPSPRYR